MVTYCCYCLFLFEYLFLFCVPERVMFSLCVCVLSCLCVKNITFNPFKYFCVCVMVVVALQVDAAPPSRAGTEIQGWGEEGWEIQRHWQLCGRDCGWVSRFVSACLSVCLSFLFYIHPCLSFFPGSYSSMSFLSPPPYFLCYYYYLIHFFCLPFFSYYIILIHISSLFFNIFY